MITINAKKFSEKFIAVAAVTPNKTTKDVLRNVLVVSDGKHLTFAASNSEIHMHAEIEYVGDVEKVLIPAARMIAILRELNGDELRLTIKSEKLQVRCGSADYQIGIEPAEGFPDVGKFDENSFYTVDAKSFKDAIRKTQFATDEKSTRYSLSGIYIEISPTMMICVATDSRRLSKLEIPYKTVQSPVWPMANPSVPVAAMKIVAGIEVDGDIRFIATNNGFKVKAGDISVICQTIQGRFPSYAKVIPEESTFTRKILIPAGSFATLLRQVRVMETEESKSIDFVFGEGNLECTSETQDIGNATAAIPISDTAEKLKIQLSGEYVAEMLKTLESSSSVEVGIIDKKSVVTFKCGNFTHVIMPISK